MEELKWNILTGAKKACQNTKKKKGTDTTEKSNKVPSQRKDGLKERIQFKWEQNVFNWRAYIDLRQSVHMQKLTCAITEKAKLILSKFWFHDEQEKQPSDLTVKKKS